MAEKSVAVPATVATEPSEAEPQAIRLCDYRAPEYLVDEVHLTFELDERRTIVRSRLHVRPNPACASHPGAATPPLRLDGRDIDLLEVRLDGRSLDPSEYTVDATGLTLAEPVTAVIETTVAVDPSANTALEGLYRSGDMFCTQCEPEGFRKITYFIDRPDVMARFRTRLVADREQCPVLLSNGNPAGSGVLEDGRHWTEWDDPVPKPSYLFALVAGRLERVAGEFRTMSGRRIALELYVEERNLGKCEHALASLVNAMRWDERVYGREYDLDVYMIVAADDFNMGAMENKGLNIFNSRYVLADPETATDDDFVNVEGVIAHEYFHNWTGNRVTCRDWFQLSLKEGLTVFRDQEFSADMGSRAVKRIGDVQLLRGPQFAEDSGPMAHPVQPQSYIEINNFYTATIYNKGAEVIRMVHAMVGPETFRRATDLYFERHDGQAVTIEELLAAVEDASGRDLDGVRLWYRQAGTPTLAVRRDYDEARRRLTLNVEQSCPPTPGQQEMKSPMLMPLAIGLLAADGRSLPIRLDGEAAAPETPTRILEIRERAQAFTVLDVPPGAVPSLLRGFSAPVRLDTDLTEAELAFLAANDCDPFNRWEAGQRLSLTWMLRLVSQRADGAAVELPGALLEATRCTLTADELDPALRAVALVLPSETYVADQMDVVDIDGIHDVRTQLRDGLAERLHDHWLAAYRAGAATGGYDLAPDQIARRALLNVSLAYLVRSNTAEMRALALEQLQSADNMTDRLAALAALAGFESVEREEALERFYRGWGADPLVFDKWLAIQAASSLPDTLDRVRALSEHPAYSATNPNRVRALVGTFVNHNPVRFHATDGQGYAFLADEVLRLDPLNSLLAARLVGALSRWRRPDAARGALMRAELERILAKKGLSKDVFEIVSKSLA